MRTIAPSVFAARATARPVLLAVAALAMTACTALPANRAEEVLDERTGTTVTRLARPLELLSTRARGPAADPFAYLGPFETNRMGTRRSFLWLSVPEDAGQRIAEPRAWVDGKLLELGGPIELAQAGLGSWPYETPAPWSRVLVFDLRGAALERLLAARELAIADGAEGDPQFTATGEPAAALGDFRVRLGL